MKRRRFEVSSAEAGTLLVPAVARNAGVSEDDASQLLARGAVYVKGKRQSANGKLREGDIVTVVLEEAGRPTLPQTTPTEGTSDSNFTSTGGADAARYPKVRVLFEDEHVLAVAKPSGVDAQPSMGHAEPSLLDWADRHLGRKAGLVHRLDRETSGVTVFGKTLLGTSGLAEAFREGTAKKRYVAVCATGIAEQGDIDWPLSKDPSHPGRYRASKSANGVSAFTHWERLFDSEAYALVALFPKTGRTHQLRAHLTALGSPIHGDARYRGARRVLDRDVERCLLHAQTLVLPHPETGRPLELQVKPPPDLLSWFELAKVALPEGSSF